MFRHKGKARTFTHNFRLAAFLSFIAGLVNICGVLALGVLTTNVTGHFAYFAEGVVMQHNLFGAHFIFYIFSFLSGSFISGLLTEYATVLQRRSPHNAAIFLEILLLLAMGFYGDALLTAGFAKPLLACVLLFTMGLQNSMVSRISNAAVRTTHLTGLFTDLGIELSQLFFYKEEAQKKKLWHSIGLRSGIVAFFFLGCVMGGYLYITIQFKVLILAAVVLLIAWSYGNLRIGYYKFKKMITTIRH